MDIKEEIKEESSFLDFYSQNQREIFPKDSVKKIKSETVTNSSDCGIDTKTGLIEEEDVVPKFYSLYRKEFGSEDSVIGYNKSRKDSEIKAKIEIKEELCWVETASAETLCIYDDVKDGTDEDFYYLPTSSFYKERVSSCTSDLFSNKDLRNDTSFNIRKDRLECESARKCQSQESVTAVISSIETSVCSEIPDGGRIVSIPSCLKQNNLLQQSHTNKQNINKESCKSVLDCGYRKAYRCDICGKSFKYASHLKYHQLIHEGKKLNKCDICEKGFNQLSCLKTHKLIHQGKKPHKCNTCDKAFTQLSNLKAHKLIHEGKRANKCDICEKAFNQLSCLKRHKLIHEDKKPHECNICDKSFTRISYLKAHKLIHEGIKPNKCDICHKTFTHLPYLKTHKLIHEDSKPHRCNVCDKAFTQLSNLKAHKLIHEGKKPNKCNICDKSFTQLSNLKTHKLIHEGKKPYRCDICDKAFTQLSNLKTHKVTHEPK